MASFKGDVTSSICNTKINRFALIFLKEAATTATAVVASGNVVAW
jgi:hypothetical protein